MALNIHTSNRMENLIEALAEALSISFPDPMKPEIIVVQSKGMERWVSMELAERFEIWGNCEYPFPNDMVWRLAKALLPDIPDVSPFAPHIMSWKIMEFLPHFLDTSPFVPLRGYLAGDANGLKRFQLAEKIADSFDQYTLFRSDMLLAWEAGEGRGDEEWQAVLWRELTRTYGIRHRGTLKEEYLRRVGISVSSENKLPERIALFGVSYLPAYHLEVLAATARLSEINLFLLSPTREYWSDIVPARTLARLAPEKRATYEEGHPLLASLGAPGRDFSDMLLEMTDHAVVQEDLYSDPGADTLLHSIQSGILNLSKIDENAEKRSISSDDHSIQIHSCHSPMREIEVLHDNLLDLLNREKDLEPRHIVVMTPDIELYAPYIAAVFEKAGDQSGKIPFSIADRNLASEGRVADVVLKLLELNGTRMTASQMLDILESSPVSRRFGLNEGELETIRTWIAETRIRWGLDENYRIGMGLPAYGDNSWRAGLDRLLLGRAMPEDKEHLFNDILPYDALEGSGAAALGKLIDFVEKSSELAKNLNIPRSLGEWRDSLQRMLSDFMTDDGDTAQEMDMIAGVVSGMGEMEELSGYNGLVEPAVIRSWFDSRLKREQRGQGFITGGVTFCAMLPMRSIPFRVVALIGMSDGAFPRWEAAPGFDLIARNPKRGDRSLRNEDRYLFLESILSARQYVYISYVGQSVKDNSEAPPSTLVSELLGGVGREFVSADAPSIEDRLVTRHRLQAFSREYFTESSSLFSYSEENRVALAEKRDSPGIDPSFINHPLPEPSEEWRNVTLEQLAQFFKNPSDFFLKNRLKIFLEDVASQLDEEESFGFDSLESYCLKSDLLEMILRGDDPTDFFPVARARGILPPMRHGQIVFDEALNAAADFAKTLPEEIGGASPLPALDFEFELDGFTLSGRLDRIWPTGVINYRCAKMKSKYQISAWLQHLALNIIRPEGYPLVSFLFMTDRVFSLKPAEDARAILKTLLDYYWKGLSEPLRFFPESSFAYADKLEYRVDRANNAWKPNYDKSGKGEGEDPAFRLCFGKSAPFDVEFEEISRAVMEPMIKNIGSS